MARGFPSFKTGYKHTVYCINGFLNTLMFALMQRGVDCTYTRYNLSIKPTRFLIVFKKKFLIFFYN